jgi:hypothetical protein
MQNQCRGQLPLLYGVAIVTAGCGALPSLPFAGDGKLLDFGAKESIARYQLRLATLSASAAQRQFTFSGVPTNQYWLAFVIDGADRDNCMDIFHASGKGVKGIDVDFGFKDANSGDAVVPTMLMSGWRVSLSPGKDSY